MTDDVRCAIFHTRCCREWDVVEGARLRSAATIQRYYRSHDDDGDDDDDDDGGDGDDDDDDDDDDINDDHNHHLTSANHITLTPGVSAAVCI